MDNWIQVRNGSWAVFNDMDGRGHGHAYLTVSAGMSHPGMHRAVAHTLPAHCRRT